MNANEELRRLQGVAADDSPGGAGVVRFAGVTESDPEGVLERAREALTAVLTHSVGEWPSPDLWLRLLPPFFVEAAAPETSKEQADRWLAEWRKLNPSDQTKADDAVPWSLADWLYWMEPERREWHWWSAGSDKSTQLWVEVQVDGWPTAIGSLRWLLKAAGARELSDPE